MPVVASAIIAGVSAVGAIASSVKAGKASKRAAQSRAAITKLENARERRNQVRDARLAQGSLLAQSATRGGGGGFGGISGSAQQGGAASLTAQLTSNLAFIRKAGELNETASRQEIRASDASTAASIFSGISNASLGVGGLFA